MHVPLSQPDITELEIDAVVATLRSTQLSLGPRMEEFEERVAALAGVPFGIAVSSGTAGLHLGVRALGIGPGDEVIVPSFTFIAAANAIRYEGATPVFVDIDPRTLNMDPARVAEAITPRTRAIMAVHTFGLPAPMEALQAIAQRHNLFLIEDACEAIGALCQGRPAGSFGDLAVFAFYPNKQITTGEGGVVVTRNATLAREIRALRNQGRYPSDAWHQHSILGFNYRLSEISCALGCAQMQRLEEILASRAHVAAIYAQHLRNYPEIELPPEAPPGDRISWFVYVARLGKGQTATLRDGVAQRLQARGIQCGRYFAPVHGQPAYDGWPLPHPLAVTETESRRTLALPFFTKLSEPEIAYVASELGAAVQETAQPT